MTEGQGKHSDDQASPPPQPPEFPERFANPSGPVPRRPESDPPEPPSAENGPWGDAPPGRGGAASRGDAPSSGPLTFEKLFQSTDQPGSQNLGAPDEGVVSDRSTGLGGGALGGDAPSSDPLTFEKLFQSTDQPGSQNLGAPDERAVVSDTPRPAPPIGPQDRDGPGEPDTQTPWPRPDRFPQHEQQPHDIAPRPGEPPPRPAPPIGPQDRGGPGEPDTQTPSPRPDRFPQHEQQPHDIAPRPGKRPPRPVPFPAPPGPPWQQPPGGWPADDHGFNHAQGSAAGWNYVDSIRSSELVPTRRIPPGRGWRKVVYIASFNLVNLGQSPDERYQGVLETKIRSLLRGTYKIGVLGKGGVGKSTISASVGSVFAELRQNDRVVAVDADTGFGKLGSRIDPAASGSYWELAADSALFTFSDIRSRVGSNKSGLFVLPGEAATARRRILDADIYRKATSKLDQHFTLSVVDCGSTVDSPVTREVLADVDALIVVSSLWWDGASAAGQTLDWLANGGYSGLLHRTVVVFNDSDKHAAKRDRALLVERFGGRGQKVIEMPYDENLRPGGVIDVREELNRLTRRRLMELAAACAEHFAATAERPRVRDDCHPRQGGHRRLRDADPGVEPGVAPGR
jgi:MinD-like ATPase involved in chromosome partitioning or flagellar assembly